MCWQVGKWANEHSNYISVFIFAVDVPCHVGQWNGFFYYHLASLRTILTYLESHLPFRHSLIFSQSRVVAPLYDHGVSSTSCDTYSISCGKCCHPRNEPLDRRTVPGR
jgi:hypothetical protein